MTDASAIFSLLIVLLLGAFIYGPWQAICTDFARQVIFEKRDAIFDMADRGELSFDDREYRMIRIGLERLIRFAHELTLPSLLFFWFFVKPHAPNEMPELLQAIDHIRDDKVRGEVFALVDQALMAAFAMIIVKSPLTIILTAMLVPVVIVSFGVRQFAKALFGRSKIVIQFEAERVGSLEGAAAV